jgi:hypothetical protein
MSSSSFTPSQSNSAKSAFGLTSTDPAGGLNPQFVFCPSFLAAEDSPVTPTSVPGLSLRFFCFIASAAVGLLCDAGLGEAERDDEAEPVAEELDPESEEDAEEDAGETMGCRDQNLGRRRNKGL